MAWIEWISCWCGEGTDRGRCMSRWPRSSPSRHKWTWFNYCSRLSNLKITQACQEPSYIWHYSRNCETLTVNNRLVLSAQGPITISLSLSLSLSQLTNLYKNLWKPTIKAYFPNIYVHTNKGVPKLEKNTLEDAPEVMYASEWVTHGDFTDVMAIGLIWDRAKTLCFGVLPLTSPLFLELCFCMYSHWKLDISSPKSVIQTVCILQRTNTLLFQDSVMTSGGQRNWP